MIKFLNKNKIFLTLMLIFSALIVCAITYLSRNCTYYGDDLSHSLYHNGLLDSIIPTDIHSAFKLHGGGCLCLLLTNFFNFNLPNMLGIHPADFMGIPHGVIKGIFTCLVLISITNFSRFFKKSRMLYILIFTSIFLYFLYSILSINSFVIGFNHSFYRYIFPLLFFSYFAQYIYKNAYFKTKQNTAQLIVASICAIIIGTSVEILFFSSIMLCVLIMLNFKFKLNKNFYIPVFCLAFSILSFITSQGFKSIASERGMNNIQINLAEIKNFILDFFQICIVNEWIVWLIFCLLVALSFIFAKKKQYSKKLIFPLLLAFSILTVMFSLILCGKSFYTEGEYWLSHPNIQILYRMMILYPVLVYFSYCAKFIKLPKFLCVLIMIIFISITYNTSISIIKLKGKSYWYNNSSILARTKKTNYIVDKMYRFYQIKGEKIQLPIELKQYKKPYIDFFLWSRDCKDINSDYCTRGILNSEYYPKIYKDNSISEYYFSENSIKDFYKKGGSFTQEELENIKFQNLLNENFVLKEDKEKTPVVDIYPIF